MKHNAYKVKLVQKAEDSQITSPDRERFGLWGSGGLVKQYMAFAKGPGSVAEAFFRSHAPANPEHYELTIYKEAEDD